MAVGLDKGLESPPAEVVRVNLNGRLPTPDAGLPERKIGSSLNSRAKEIANSNLHRSPVNSTTNSFLFSA